MSGDDPAVVRAAIERSIDYLADRMAAVEAEQRGIKEGMREAVREAVREGLDRHECPVSDDEHRWVRLAIEREARREAFQRAVMEKTLTGLL